MPKLDLKKELRSLYDAPKTPTLVEVPALNFLMIDGQGDPRDQEYLDSVEALFGLAYTLKFMIKKEGGQDYGVLPLEGLWWAEDMADFLVEKRDKWKWTSLIMQPELVTAAHVEKAIAELKKKKDPVALPRVRFERFDEGLSVQVMHLGPYSAERPTVHALHSFAEREGYRPRGKHHEIYLGDPRKAAPEKLKTILRQPVEMVQ